MSELKVIRTEVQFQALGDEFMSLNESYRLLEDYGITFEMFVTKPWYYRVLTELLEDGGTRPLLLKQQRAAEKADREMRRAETTPRLHNGATFQRLHHHRHPRRGLSAFFRRQS